MDENVHEVPVWTLAVGDATVPPVFDDRPMTRQRLTELRTALATLAETPIATLEVHPAPAGLARTEGMSLGAESPLAGYLTELIGKALTPGGAPPAGQALYRMVVPSKVAAQFGSGLIQPMLANSVPGGIHSALVGASGIAGQAAFVRVAGTAAAGGGALSVAPPLIMMAIAAGLSARSEMASRRAAEMLEQMRQEKLDDDRNRLESCRSPIEKATAILLDQGKVGHSLGLSAAVDKIETAITAARRNLKRWESALDDFPAGPVELARIKKRFPGLADPSGEFCAQLDLAELAISLKRRVNVLQAVEHAEINPDNSFDRFMRQLSDDERAVDELERGIAEVVRRLSDLEVDRSHGMLDFVFTLGEVDELLTASRRLRELGRGVLPSPAPTDVAIEMLRDEDGSVLVLPAVADS